MCFFKGKFLYELSSKELEKVVEDKNYSYLTRRKAATLLKIKTKQEGASNA